MSNVSALKGAIMKILIHCALICCLFLSSSAQISPFIHYTTKDGLSNNTVFAIAQDSAGYMWLGTGDGLNRFDGYSFETFHKSDGLGASEVQALSIDDKKTLWISNRTNGFYKWEKSK